MRKKVAQFQLKIKLFKSVVFSRTVLKRNDVLFKLLLLKITLGYINLHSLKRASKINRTNANSSQMRPAAIGNTTNKECLFI